MEQGQAGDVDIVAQKMALTLKQGTKTEKPRKTLQFITGDSLQALKLEPVEFIVDGFLPVGLNLLASPPKYGKSFLVLDLCLSVASGKKFLGFNTKKTECLYLALEDSWNRLQDRMNKVLNGEKAPPGFMASIQAHDLEHGLIEELTNFISDRPNTRLIIIDTFQRVRTDGKRGQSAYSLDYEQAGRLKRFADAHKICLLLVHHTKKSRDPSDVFSNISGTQGIFGACDSVYVLSREDRTDEQTKLSIIGRDVAMNEYMLIFNKDKYRWSIAGTADEIEEAKARQEYEQNPIVRTIRQLLSMEPTGWTGTCSDLLELGKKLSGCYLAENASILGKKITALEKPLFEYDNILHSTAGNGTGGKKHTFYYGYNPFLDT